MKYINKKLKPFFWQFFLLIFTSSAYAHIPCEKSSYCKKTEKMIRENRARIDELKQEQKKSKKQVDTSYQKSETTGRNIYTLIDSIKRSEQELIANDKNLNMLLKNVNSLSEKHIQSKLKINEIGDRLGVLLSKTKTKNDCERVFKERKLEGEVLHYPKYLSLNKEHKQLLTQVKYFPLRRSHLYGLPLEVLLAMSELLTYEFKQYEFNKRNWTFGCVKAVGSSLRSIINEINEYGVIDESDKWLYKRLPSGM